MHERQNMKKIQGIQILPRSGMLEMLCGDLERCVNIAICRDALLRMKLQELLLLLLENGRILLESA